jgi:hypothetical protein
VFEIRQQPHVSQQLLRSWVHFETTVAHLAKGHTTICKATEVDVTCSRPIRSVQIYTQTTITRHLVRCRGRPFSQHPQALCWPSSSQKRLDCAWNPLQLCLCYHQFIRCTCGTLCCPEDKDVCTQTMTALRETRSIAFIVGSPVFIVHFMIRCGQQNSER